MEHASNVLFHIGPLEVTSTVTTMWAIIAVLTLVSWLATRSLKEIPGPLQTGAEMAVGALRNFYEGTLGRAGSTRGSISRSSAPSSFSSSSATTPGCCPARAT